jgi:hydroxyacylglutathione hydrolase
LARAFLILLGLGALLAAAGWARYPRPLADRVEALPGVVGVASGGGSMSWIIRTPNGAALVDAGLDPEATALRAELQRMGLGPPDVHTILLTHAHFDHWAGAAAFPHARVVAGPGEGALIRGEVKPRRWLVATFTRLLSSSKVPANLEELTGDADLEVDGLTLRALHVPGHTPGSLVFLHGPVLFTGDSAVGASGGKGLRPPFTFLSDDPVENRRALQRLLELPFTLVADGHTGVIPDARQRLAEALR